MYVFAALPDEPTVQNDSLVGLRVVIVEDEGMTALQLRKLLARAGMVVAAVAMNGPEGVQAVLRERPDLVTMDANMPGEYDGIEATRRIVEAERVCVVIVSAYAGDEEFHRRAAEAGACGCAGKPVTSQTLPPLLLDAYRKFRQPPDASAPR